MKQKTLNIKKILHISGFYMENLYIGGKNYKNIEDISSTNESLAWALGTGLFKKSCTMERSLGKPSNFFLNQPLVPDMSAN